MVYIVCGDDACAEMMKCMFFKCKKFTIHPIGLPFGMGHKATHLHYTDQGFCLYLNIITDSRMCGDDATKL